MTQQVVDEPLAKINKVIACQFIEVCGHLFVRSSLNVPRQHFSQLRVGTLTGPLQNPGSFLFQPFCFRLAAVLGIILLLHDPVSATLYLSDRQP